MKEFVYQRCGASTCNQITGQVKNNHVLEDNRESSIQSKKLYSIQQKQNTELQSDTPIKSNGHIVQMMRPGDAAPSKQSQLTARFKEMGTEAGITPKILVDEMINLMNVQMVFPPPVVLPHPLAPSPPITGRQLALDAIQAQLNANNAGIADVQFFKIAVSNRELVRAANANVIDDYASEIDTLIDPWVSSAERAVYTSAVLNPNTELRNAVLATTATGDQLSKAATSHLANSARPLISELNPVQKVQLSTQLKRMPVVIRMLNGTLGEQGASAQLLNGIDTTGGAMLSEPLIDKVGNALNKLGDLVDEDVLPAREKVPNIEINPDTVHPIPQTVMDKIKGIQRTFTELFRADANRKNSKVRISALSELDLIVHEFGHQIEFHLPVDDWLDIVDLLQMRHKGGNLISIYPASTDPLVRNEAAYDADMPATGLYSAKTYDDGATEVMSMTLEYFSTPENAKKMIESDPLQAAIILRIIKPVEFHNAVSTELRALLPRGDLNPGAHANVPVVNPIVDGVEMSPWSQIGDSDL